MEINFSVCSEVDGLELDVLAAEPPQGTARRALLQISHGMCEYKERYLPFMRDLAGRGIVTVIHDHRGHGKSVKSAEDLGYMYGAGAKGLVADLHQITRKAKELYPDLPFILFGHSMGSLAARVYTKNWDAELDALMLCGSPSEEKMRPLGTALARAEGALRGGHHRSKLLEGLSFGPYVARFPEETSRFAWVCSDPAVVQEYEENPLCGFTFTDDAFLALLDLMKETYEYRGWHCTKSRLPVLFLSGGDDPCYGDVKRFKSAIEHMSHVGYHNVRGKLYPGMRHEILNEKEKYRVYEDVCKWLRQVRVLDSLGSGSLKDYGR